MTRRRGGVTGRRSSRRSSPGTGRSPLPSGCALSWRERGEQPVHARAVVRAVVRRGRTVLDELRSEAPLGLFSGLDPEPGSAQVWLVGSAGGPLGGDDIELGVE